MFDQKVIVNERRRRRRKPPESGGPNWAVVAIALFILLLIWALTH